MCDFYEMLGNWGRGAGYQEAAQAKGSKYQKGLKNLGETRRGAMGIGLGKGLSSITTDLCTSIFIQGDATLSWPYLDFPVPWAAEGESKNRPIDEKDLERWGGELVWAGS